MLDSSLKKTAKTQDKERGVHGELWAVHGGGFYNSQKFLTGPVNEPLTEDLHWSKWESYTTWITGFFLFVVIYWYRAEIYLIDASVYEFTKVGAIAASAAFLVGVWIVYDLLCKSPLARHDGALGAVVFLLLSLAAFALCHLFSGRGAFITFGAMVGTTMVANVFFVIIPGQKKMVAAIREGREVDPEPGRRGKQRSVHNTYFTLPVLFTMISGHYAMTYGHEHNWLILIGISAAGALIRLFFVSRHVEAKTQYVAASLAVFILIGVFALMAPSSDNDAATFGEQARSTAAIQAIITERCASCHSSAPTQPGFTAPPSGIAYDSFEQIEAQREGIYQQVVVSRVMPIGNLTAMTEEEREQIGAWFHGPSDNGS